MAGVAVARSGRPAARPSVRAWRGRSRPSPRRCSWTSRPPHSTRRLGRAHAHHRRRRAAGALVAVVAGIVVFADVTVWRRARPAGDPAGGDRRECRNGRHRAGHRVRHRHVPGRGADDRADRRHGRRQRDERRRGRRPAHVDEVAGRREEIEARLALGPPADEAAKPLSRGVLRTAISPQVERRRVFTPDHRLIPLRRSAEQTTAFWRAAATSGRYRCSDSRWHDF